MQDEGPGAEVGAAGGERPDPVDVARREVQRCRERVVAGSGGREVAGGGLPEQSLGQRRPPTDPVGVHRGVEYGVGGGMGPRQVFVAVQQQRPAGQDLGESGLLAARVHRCPQAGILACEPLQRVAVAGREGAEVLGHLHPGTGCRQQVADRGLLVGFALRRRPGELLPVGREPHAAHHQHASRPGRAPGGDQLAQGGGHPLPVGRLEVALRLVEPDHRARLDAGVEQFQQFLGRARTDQRPARQDFYDGLVAGPGLARRGSADEEDELVAAPAAEQFAQPDIVVADRVGRQRRQLTARLQAQVGVDGAVHSERQRIVPADRLAGRGLARADPPGRRAGPPGRRIDPTGGRVGSRRHRGAHARLPSRSRSTPHDAAVCTGRRPPGQGLRRRSRAMTNSPARRGPLALLGVVMGVLAVTGGRPGTRARSGRSSAR